MFNIFCYSPVRRVKFLPDFPPRLASFSDDKTCGIWDISEERKIQDLRGHTVSKFECIVCIITTCLNTL